MAVPVRIFFYVNEILIDTIPAPFVAGSLVATQNGNSIEIRRVQSSYLFISIAWDLVADVNGNLFNNVVDVMAYLAAQFALGPPKPPYQEALTILNQDVIPSLTMPWKQTEGGFANIIFGSATLVDGCGVVGFSNGSKSVTFDPYQAGFHLNPGETVIAQYSV